MSGHAPDCIRSVDTLGLARSVVHGRIEANCANCGGLVAFIDDEILERHPDAVTLWCGWLGVEPVLVESLLNRAGRNL